MDNADDALAGLFFLLFSFYDFKKKTLILFFEGSDFFRTFMMTLQTFTEPEGFVSKLIERLIHIDEFRT